MADKLLKARLTDDTTVKFLPEAIGSGLEKVCFLCESRQQVVLFFVNRLAAKDRLDRVDRLKKLLGDRNVVERSSNPGYWRDYFCWPTGLVAGDTSLPAAFVHQHQLLQPPLGIVAPTYRANFFFKDRAGHIREGNARWFTSEKARKLVLPADLGNFLSYLQICTKLARAVGKLHSSGLAHSDLSNKNVLISPRHGDACVSDVDTMVVPGYAPPAVLGTPGYIAPEVLCQRKLNGRVCLPCIETDRYAMGVLMYELLLKRHPIARQKPLAPDLAPEMDEFLAMGERALFIEHPEDRSNWPEPPPRVGVHHLGPALAALFRRLFIEGLHEPSRRPTAADWELALYQTTNMLHPSPETPAGQSEWFVLTPPEPGGASPELRCPFTGKLIRHSVPFARFKVPRRSGPPGDYVYDKEALTIWPGLRLMKWHLQGTLPDASSDRTPQGYFRVYKDRWIFVNQSGAKMRAADGRLLPPDQAIELKPGLQLLVSEAPGARMLEFDYMHPA